MRKVRRNRSGGGIVSKLILLLALVVIAVGVNYWKPWIIYQEQGFSGVTASLKNVIQGELASSKTEQPLTEVNPGKSDTVNKASTEPKAVTQKPATNDVTKTQMKDKKGNPPTNAAETIKSPEVKTPVAVQTKTPDGANSVISRSIGLKEMDSQTLNVLGRLQNVEIKPKTQFSMNQWLEQNNFEKKSGLEGENLAYTASLLYEAAVKAGFVIGERHVHFQLPAYAAPGFDVYIEPANHDLTFYNSLEFSITMNVKKTFDGMPQITFEGMPDSGWISHPINVKTQKFPSKPLEVMDLKMTPNAIVVKSTGVDGLLIEVRDGDHTVSRDFYAPQPSIVMKGIVEALQ